MLLIFRPTAAIPSYAEQERSEERKSVVQPSKHQFFCVHGQNLSQGLTCWCRRGACSCITKTRYRLADTSAIMAGHVVYEFLKLLSMRHVPRLSRPQQSQPTTRSFRYVAIHGLTARFPPYHPQCPSHKTVCVTSRRLIQPVYGDYRKQSSFFITPYSGTLASRLQSGLGLDS